MGVMKCPRCDYELRAPTTQENMMRKTLLGVAGTDFGGYEIDGFHCWDELYKINEAHAVGRYWIRKVEEDTSHSFDYAQNQVFMVFEVGWDEEFTGPSDFYKVEGVKDSYGSARWDGNFREVEKQEKAVWLWSE